MICGDDEVRVRRNVRSSFVMRSQKLIVEKRLQHIARLDSCRREQTKERESRRLFRVIGPCFLFTLQRRCDG